MLTRLLPSETEAYEVLSDFSEVLRAITTDATDDELDKARELIGLLTGGRIDVYQCGEKKAQRGWLQVRLKVNLAAVLMDRSGIDDRSRDDNFAEIVVDVREDVPENPKIALARQLYDQDYFENEIAAELKAGRASVCNWIRQSFAAEGKTRRIRAP